MSAVAAEAQYARDLIERVETLERVAESLPQPDERRSTLLELIQRDLSSASPMRPRIVAELLDLSEHTVRAWTAEGVLVRSDTTSPRLLLDVARVHVVLHLVQSLRAAGKTVGLLDEVHRRFSDETWLKREDLAESLAEMSRGEGVVRVPLPQA